MADVSDGLNHKISMASKRSRYAARKEFPDSIVRFAKKVEDYMLENEISITLARFKHEFISAGQCKVGFFDYVERIIPEIHTDEEFMNLLAILGYDVMDEGEEPEGIRVLVCGSETWSDSRFMLHTLRQLPAGSIIIEGGAKGADTMAARYADQLGFEVEEFSANTDSQELLDEGEPDVVIAFHESIADSEATKEICLLAKRDGIPVKILSGTKRVEILQWLEEVLLAIRTKESS